MRQRPQVPLAEFILAEICRIARRHKVTTAAWVRQALRAARQAEPASDSRQKLVVIRATARHRFPTADIDQMLAEIDSLPEVTRPERAGTRPSPS